MRKIQTKITLSLTTEQAERHARAIAASGLSQNKFVHKALEDQVKLSKEVNELRERVRDMETVIRMCYAVVRIPGNYQSACYCVRQTCQDALLTTTWDQNKEGDHQ